MCHLHLTPGSVLDSKIITDWMNLCIFILKHIKKFDILQEKHTTHKKFLANKINYSLNFHMFVLILRAKHKINQQAICDLQW